MTIELDWKGPFTVRDLSKIPDDFNKGGIYIWGFSIDGEFVPHYIGKANSRTRISYRIYQHIANLKSGSCTIWDKDDLRSIPERWQDRLEKAKFLPPVLIRQTSPLYEKYRDKYDYGFLLNHWDTFKEDIDFMWHNFAFGFAACPDDILADIENKIINDLELKWQLLNLRKGISKIESVNHKGAQELAELFEKTIATNIDLIEK